jgi:hypothetical protein
MSVLARLRRASETKLSANPVAVPELQHVFGADEPTLMHVASLSAFDKDRMDTAFVAYKKEFQLEDSMEVYRAFVVAYCLCDENNVRVAPTNDVLFETTNLLANLGNKIVSRLFTVANGANGIFGLPEVVEKKSLVAVPSATSTAGNGASPSVLATQVEQPGFVISSPLNTPSSDVSTTSSPSV